MDRESTIYVAGHRGLVGSALMVTLQQAGYTNVIVSDYLDLANSFETRRFFNDNRPEYVFLAAAKVGGIQANNTYPVDFLTENIEIQSNVFASAQRYDVTKLLFLGSSCIYPKYCEQPIREEHILSGKLEETNDAYAIAKLSGVVGCRAYNRQYRTNFIAAMPTNLYGPRDNFDLNSSHVIPALIRKMHEAKTAGKDSVTLWGDGSPSREFLYIDDLALALVTVMNAYEPADNSIENLIVNIGCGYDIRIKDLAAVVQEVIDFRGTITWDTDKPNGTPKKCLSVERLHGLGWKPQVALHAGLEATYAWYLKEGKSEAEYRLR